MRCTQTDKQRLILIPARSTSYRYAGPEGYAIITVIIVHTGISAFPFHPYASATIWILVLAPPRLCPISLGGPILGLPHYAFGLIFLSSSLFIFHSSHSYSMYTLRFNCFPCVKILRHSNYLSESPNNHTLQSVFHKFVSVSAKPQTPCRAFTSLSL